MHGFCFALILSATFCRTPSADRFKCMDIPLQNQLGLISMLIPVEFDTFFTWKNVSDCGACCDLMMYRFADKDYSLLQETGMFPTQIPDSLLQFTISHKAGKKCDKDWRITLNTRDSLVSVLEAQDAENFVGGEPIYWLRREFLSIDKHAFVILGYRSKHLHGYASSGIPTVVEAITIIDNQILQLTFECTGSDCTKFVAKIDKSLRSIRFKKLN